MADTTFYTKVTSNGGHILGHVNLQLHALQCEGERLLQQSTLCMLPIPSFGLYRVLLSPL